MDEQEIISLMQQHGIRPTANRIIVVKTLAEGPHPLSMSELEDRIGSIDKSGIFRALTLFKEQHLVHTFDATEGTRYELCHSLNHQEDNDLHVHFHCERCGQTVCLTDIPIPEVALPEGFEVENANFVVKGLCPNCGQKTQKENKVIHSLIINHHEHEKDISYPIPRLPRPHADGTGKQQD